jgi:hypothetical protein
LTTGFSEKDNDLGRVLAVLTFSKREWDSVEAGDYWGDGDRNWLLSPNNEGETGLRWQRSQLSLKKPKMRFFAK